MIGKLKGIVDSYVEDHVILDVQGVGYLVHCSARTLQQLPSPGEAATLFIETFVREDMIRLYGFASPAEKAWFTPACRTCRASAPRWRCPCSPCFRLPSSPMRWRWATGRWWRAPMASARRSPPASSPS